MIVSLMFLALLPAVGSSPAGELAAAHADLVAHVPADQHRSTRYLTLYALPPEERQEAAAVVSFVLNAVSRAPRIVRPKPVPGSGWRLWRISLDDYGLPAEVWEAMAAEDPYFHLRTQVRDPQSKETRTVYTDGGWVNLAVAAALRERTASGGAVLRADFFVARAASTARGGYYYRLAGVPEREADFYKLLGLDLKSIDRLQADKGANLIRSGVTRKLRRVVRRQGPLGGVWSTFDVEQNTAERDPLRNPFGFEYDASEHIAARANGLHLFALYNRQGVRQDSVPDVLAKDSSDLAGDGIIVPLLACVRCHVENGLRPFDSDQRRLLARNVDLLTEKPADAERLAAFYAGDLDKLLQRDGDDYAQAVAAATAGRSVPQVAAALARLYRGYVDELVTPAQAAREVGLEPQQLAAVLRSSHDPALLALSEGIAIQRQQWEAAFAEAAVLAAGRW